jgi:hypothetical protein
MVRGSTERVCAKTDSCDSWLQTVAGYSSPSIRKQAVEVRYFRANGKLANDRIRTNTLREYGEDCWRSLLLTLRASRKCRSTRFRSRAFLAVDLERWPLARPEVGDLKNPAGAMVRGEVQEDTPLHEVSLIPLPTVSHALPVRTLPFSRSPSSGRRLQALVRPAS